MLNLRHIAHADFHASDLNHVIRNSVFDNFELENMRFRPGGVTRDVENETHSEEVQSSGTGEA